MNDPDRDVVFNTESEHGQSPVMLLAGGVNVTIATVWNTAYHVIQGVSNVCLRRDVWRAHGFASTLCQTPLSLSSHRCPSRTGPLRMGLSCSGTLNRTVCKPSAASSPRVGPGHVGSQRLAPSRTLGTPVVVL